MCPWPIRKLFLIPLCTKLIDIRTLSLRLLPKNKFAVKADARLQPVPWVFLVLILLFRNLCIFPWLNKISVTVFLFSTSLRLKEIYLNKILNKSFIDPEQHRHPPFIEESRILKNAQRNLVNLFEFPIFFPLYSIFSN